MSSLRQLLAGLKRSSLFPMLLAIACVTSASLFAVQNVDAQSRTIQGRASFYADWFNGHKTANGETFSNSRMTAAHRSLPFGTKVQVTNLRNGRKAVVTINDRGPYVANRVIDLSHRAALKLGMVEKGVQRVRLKVLD